MEKVLGIGGFFWRAKDPDALGKWYEDMFGIVITPTSYDAEPWRQEAGITILAPFKETTTYISAGKEWMINFRVRDLRAMAAQLEAAGVKVDIDPEHYPNGWFAMLKDPEGNNIQLWEEEPFVPPPAAA